MIFNDLSDFEATESEEYTVSYLICEKLSGNKGFAYFADVRIYGEIKRVRINLDQFERLKIGDKIYHSWIIYK